MKRTVAVGTALIVTFLWSTSYILNKWAFAEGIGPLTLAGLRYALAAVVLGVVRWARRLPKSGGEGPTLLQYLGLGLAGYVVAQGAQYMGQFYVTPTQATLVLSVGNTLLAILAGAFVLGEQPARWQWIGITAALGAVLVYYHPWRLESGNLLGILLILFSGLGYAGQLTANRALLGRGRASPLDLVLYPMAVGAVGMLLLGLWLEPWPGLNLRLLGLLLWLGPVNGALAFFLWTWSQQELQAFESSILNNTMLLQIAGLDVWLLGRSLSARQVFALLGVGASILLVQAARRKTG